MDKYFMWIHYERLHNHNIAKHNKTVCIFLGIYCKFIAYSLCCFLPMLPIFCKQCTLQSPTVTPLAVMKVVTTWRWQYSPYNYQLCFNLWSYHTLWRIHLITDVFQGCWALHHMMFIMSIGSQKRPWTKHLGKVSRYQMVYRHDNQSINVTSHERHSI